MRRGSPMRPLGKVILTVVCIAALLSAGGLVPEPVHAADKVRLAKVVGGFNQPLFVTGAGTGSNRLFVVERPGRIRVVKQGRLLATPFLNITGLVGLTGERGLLGLAFHPNYESNGQFFVDYTDADNGDIIIARYTVSSGNPDVADPASAQVLLTIPHREAENHNGGMLAFGPSDGYLYIAVGDGGGGQSANAQDTRSLLGKILRIDVDGTSVGGNYGIPPDNPFADGANGLPEIWAYGLRNPFRFSFDRQTGDIFIGDVGQHQWEEIDFGAQGQGGLNYGWDITEGRHCFKPPQGCDKTGLTLPIHEYSHDIGNVVTGGYRYRGRAVPSLVGTYVFTDFGSQVIWGLRNRQGKWERKVLLRTKKELNTASFGESDAGEIFAVDLDKGVLYRVKKA